jgi:hypothetical protein
MIAIMLNGAFGAGFLAFAFSALRRGWPFARSGWLAIQTSTADPAFRQSAERRRAISEGGRFLVAGLMWLGAGVGSVALGAYFTLQTILLMRAGV